MPKRKRDDDVTTVVPAEAMQMLLARVKELQTILLQKQRELTPGSEKHQLLEAALGNLTTSGYSAGTLIHLQQQLETALVRPDEITVDQAHSFIDAFQKIRNTHLSDSKLEKAGFRLGFRQRVQGFFSHVLNRIKSLLFGTRRKYTGSMQTLTFKYFTPVAPADTTYLTTEQLKQSKQPTIIEHVNTIAEFSRKTPGTNNPYPIHKELDRALLVNGKSYKHYKKDDRTDQETFDAWDTLLKQKLNLDDQPELFETLRHALNQNQSNILSFLVAQHFPVEKGLMFSSETSGGKLRLNLLHDPNTDTIYHDVDIDMSAYMLRDFNNVEENTFTFSGKVHARFELTDKGFKLNEVTIRNADDTECQMLHDMFMQDADTFDASRYPRLHRFVQDVQQGMPDVHP